MFRDLPKYAETTSNSFWSTRTPAHWAVHPGLAVMQENRHKNTGLVETQVLSLSYGQVVVKPLEKQRGLVPDSYEGYQILEPGDIVVRPTDLQNDKTSVRVGHVKDRGIITSAYIGLRPTGDWNGAYAYQYLIAIDSTKRIYGMGSGLRQQLGWGDLKRMPCLVPPIEEQAAIVKYLEHANARIDKAIAAKRRLVALIEEQRRAHNLERIQGGAGNPGTWPRKRLKWVVRLQRGYDLPADERDAGPFPVISSGGVIATHSEARVDGPGVVIGRYGSTGAVFYVEDKFWPHNTALYVTDFQGNHPRWCYWLLRSIDKTVYAEKSAVPGVDRKDLYEIAVSVPPGHVQMQVVEEIERDGAQFDSVAKRYQDEISLLQEFRTRLVADVVTGQVDVRAIAASLPDTPEQGTGLDSLLDDDLEDALGESEE